MSSYAISTITNPSSALENFTCTVNLANLPNDWWTAVDTTDATKGRVFLASSDVECACDWISFDSSAKTGLLKFLWYGTLPSTGTNQVKIFPPLSTNDSYSVSDTYGRYNAYDSNTVAHYPTGIGTNRKSASYDTTNTGTISLTTGQLGSAADFENTAGANTASEYGNTGYLASSSSKYLSSWFKFDALPSSTAFSTMGSATPRFYLGIRNDTQKWVGALGSGFASGSTYPAINEWHHAAVTWDSTGQHLYLYVDGTQAVDTTGVTWDQTGSNTTWIGARNLSGSHAAINGKQQEVYIGSGYRTSAWIAEDYAQINNNTTFWGTWTFTEDVSGSGSINSISNIEGVGNTPPNTGYGNINTISNIEGSGYV